MKYKLLYTMMLLFFYLIGKLLPLYGVDRTAYVDVAIDVEKLLMQTIGGDIQKISIFALGLSPYMIVMLVVQIVNALRKTSTKSKISMKKSNQLIIFLTFLLAVVQAMVNVQELVFVGEISCVFFAKFVAVLEMVTGTLVIVWMADRNGRYGIGGQTVFILVNVLEGILRMLMSGDRNDIVLVSLISFVVMIVMILMENAEIHIPMQRISIYNIYADKNYLAFKLNPIGVMPIMFSTAVFILPQLFLGTFRWLLPGDERIIWWQKNMTLAEPLGVAVYILIIYMLTIGLSFIFIGPEELTEQFLKSGDSIVNVHAGLKTKQYLMKIVFKTSVFSATTMGICIGAPLFLQMRGFIANETAMLPASVMMLTGICCNLLREMKTIHIQDSYKIFL